MSTATTRLDRTTVAAAMHRGVVTCRPTTPLSTVARAMVAHRIHCVVVRADGAAKSDWSLISDLALVEAASLGGVELPASAAAATPALAVGPAESLTQAMRLMAAHQVTHLIVVDGHGHPTGVLSTLDVAEELAEAV